MSMEPTGNNMEASIKRIVLGENMKFLTHRILLFLNHEEFAGLLILAKLSVRELEDLIRYVLRKELIRENLFPLPDFDKGLLEDLDTLVEQEEMLLSSLDEEISQ